jgi:hypothetical protein
MAEPGERMEKIQAYFQAHFRKPQMPKCVKKLVAGHEKKMALRCIAKAKDCMERMERLAPKKEPPKTKTTTTSMKIKNEKKEDNAEAKNDVVLCESPILGLSLLKNSIMEIKPGSETFSGDMTKVGEALDLARRKCAEVFNAVNAEMVESLGSARSDIGYYDGLPLKAHSKKNWKTGAIWGGYLGGIVLMSLMIEMVRLDSAAPPGIEPLPQSERLAEMLISVGIAVASGTAAAISVKFSRDAMLRKGSQRRVGERMQTDAMKTGQRTLRLLERIERHIERIRRVSGLDVKTEFVEEPAEGAAEGSSQ